MFTKWSVLRLAERFNDHQQIPLYIELRDLRDKKDVPLERLIYEYISTSRSTNTFSQFVEGLSVGLFSLILDAADEINKSDRPAICKKMIDFRDTFPEVGILLTSRDFDDIEGMRGFEHFYTRSLNKSEAIRILNKLDYDEDVKSALVKEINEAKAERHAFFLENPLMVTIMLLTFDQSKDIPTKRSAFYRRAFEALYERHDASKGIFRRDHHAGLPMDEFEKVFSTFCFGTYANGLFQIPEAELVSLFHEACRISDIDEDASKISKDAYESACLLVKEGHDYVFCHRSFQEYFVAVFLRDYRLDDISEMFEIAMRRGQGENVIEFIYEMDRQSFEMHYVSKNLKKVLKALDRSSKRIEGSLAFANYIVANIKFYPHNRRFAGWSIRHENDFAFINNISSVYPSINLVQAMINFDNDEFSFRKFPLKKARSAPGYKESFVKERARTVATLKITANSREWFDGSELDKSLTLVWKEMKNLDKLIDQRLTTTRSSTIGRFKRFSRE